MAKNKVRNLEIVRHSRRRNTAE